MYSQMGLHRIVDLGQWWKETTALPLPLGGNAVRRALGPEMAQRISQAIRESVAYALEHREEALNYALQFARDMDADLADKFVGMYVNRWTLGYGERRPRRGAGIARSRRAGRAASRPGQGGIRRPPDGPGGGPPVSKQNSERLIRPSPSLNSSLFTVDVLAHSRCVSGSLTSQHFGTTLPPTPRSHCADDGSRFVRIALFLLHMERF